MGVSGCLLVCACCVLIVGLDLSVPLSLCMGVSGCLLVCAYCVHGSVP